VTDKIHVKVAADTEIREAITAFESYICEQTLALSIKYFEKLEQKSTTHVNINNKDATLHIVKADNNLKQ
jgi:hypothetical protein